MFSWASDVTNKRSGINYSPPSINAIVMDSNPPSRSIQNEDEILPRPNSTVSE